jgi:drug/metabolite transporter (DMT)-like permease
MPPQTAPRAALGAALVTVTLWASAFVGIRAAGDELSAGPLALARLLVASVALGAFAAVRREGLPPRAALGGIVASGLLWFAVYNVALNAAEQELDAGTAAMLISIGPVLIAILAGTLLGEGFPRTLVAGCGLALAGAVVIGAATSDGVALSSGAALCLLAALCYAGAAVAQKPALARASALQVTLAACVVGTVACLPYAPQLAGEVADADGGAVAWAVYLGVFPTAVAFTTWAFALARTSAGRMGVTTYLVPPIAIVLAWGLLGETPPALAVVGGVVCVAGAAISRAQPRRRDPARPRRLPARPVPAAGRPPR